MKSLLILFTIEEERSLSSSRTKKNGVPPVKKKYLVRENRPGLAAASSSRNWETSSVTEEDTVKADQSKTSGLNITLRRAPGRPYRLKLAR